MSPPAHGFHPDKRASCHLDEKSALRQLAEELDLSDQLNERIGPLASTEDRAWTDRGH